MLCPKCRQPIDGPEEYICCGVETLAWRCRDCGKVSEGFAFPYGMCPMCSGTLEVLEPRDIDDAEAMNAIRIAFEIELGGHAFYAQAAKDAKEPELRALFAKFADMEEEHMETLARRYHAEIPEPSEFSGVERAAIFAGVKSHPEDPANLFRIAIACEERAAAFFGEKSRNSEDGSTDHQLYRELAAEEHEHAELLTTEFARWEAGKPGLL
jgi:glutamate synthase (NADPH/NADH) small chain